MAGDEHLACKGAGCQIIEDKKRLVTFALKSVKQSTIHRKRTGNKKEKPCSRPKYQENWSPRTKPTDGPTVQMCGDKEVAGKWINGQYALGQK